MHTGFKDKNHIYVLEVLNDSGEWELGMYDIPTDLYSLNKLCDYYNRRGYANNQIRIVKVL